jgi:hypothetical protein
MVHGLHDEGTLTQLCAVELCTHRQQRQGMAQLSGWWHFAHARYTWWAQVCINPLATSVCIPGSHCRTERLGEVEGRKTKKKIERGEERGVGKRATKAPRTSNVLLGSGPLP